MLFSVVWVTKHLVNSYLICWNSLKCARSLLLGKHKNTRALHDLLNLGLPLFVCYVHVCVIIQLLRYMYNFVPQFVGIWKERG